MGLTIHFVAVLAALITTHAVHGLHYPRGKTLVYKYYADVKAGTIEPTAYASQFTLEGSLYVKHDARDPKLNTAYWFALRDLKTGMYNGAATYHHQIDTLNPIEDAAKPLEEPFWLYYNETGLLQHLTIPSLTEGSSQPWQVNMKIALVSMLQLDLSKVALETQKKRQNFVSEERGIHGECSVTYDVYPTSGQNPTKDFVITKFFSPINCSHFDTRSFNYVDIDDCSVHKDDSLNVESKRVIEIQKDGEEIIIKKLYAHGGVNYLPWNRRSKVHYVLTNITFDLEQIAPVSEIESSIELPFNDLIKDPLHYGPLNYRRDTSNSPPDFTQGRHKFDENNSIDELKKLLGEAVDYSEENHLNIGVPNWKHGQTINRIHRIMSYMNDSSLEIVFDFYNNSTNPRDIAINNVFIGVMPQVATRHTLALTIKIIRERRLPATRMIEILKKLSLRPPSRQNAFQDSKLLSPLLSFDDSVPAAVRKASILCFSSLMYSSFRHQVQSPEISSIYQPILHDLFNYVKNETNYEMKVVYLMAIRNIEVGNIWWILEPIIKGELSISENPVNIRLLSIWAVEKAIAKNPKAADTLLWPIMTDSSLPVKLRIAAYEILIHIPSEVLLRRIDWFMIGETNDHLYNYHYTTIRNIVNSEEPCKSTLRDYIKKIIRYNNRHENTRYTLSAAYAYDDYDHMLEFVEKLHGGVVLNDRNNIPEVVRFDGSLVRGPEAVIDMGMRLHIQGLGDLFNEKRSSFFMNSLSISNEKILQVLQKAAQDLPPAAEIYVDLIVLQNGRVIMANHYNRNTLMDIFDDMSAYIIGRPQNDENNYYQSIRYDHLSQKKVVNDLGLPVLLESRVPVVASMQSNFQQKPTEQPWVMKFDSGSDLKLWRHGEYSLSTYNPISDSWHAMKRITAIDASLPIHKTISLDFESKSVNISFPPHSGPKIPITGIRMFIKDFVTIDADNSNETLKKSCSKCNVHEDVSIDDSQKAKFNTKYDSALTGLKWTLSVLDCELEKQPDMSDFYGAVMPTRDETWNEWRDEKKMTAHQKMKSMLLYPQLGNCGILLKLEPSPQYPTSTINFNLHTNFKGEEGDVPWFYRLKPESYEFVGIAEVIPGPTNISVMSFGLKANVDLNEGHLSNSAKLELSYKIPGAKIHKLCFNAHKNYPRVPLDPLKLEALEQETHTILSVASGYADNDDETCPRDGTMMTLTMSGEFSEEQKKKFAKDSATGLCTREMENPLYGNPNEFRPMTENCLNEAITYTTLRKYTINMAHRQVPAEQLAIMINYHKDILRSILSPYLKLNTEIIDPANLKIVAEIPMQTYPTDDQENHIQTEPWLSGFRLTNVNDVDDNVSEPLWWAPLDNIRFNSEFLSDYTEHKIRMCAVQPRIIMTADYKSIPFEIPQDWTLISGDHGTKLFAIFAKSVGGKLAARIYVGNNEVEIMPNANNSTEVKIDGNNVLLNEIGPEVMVGDPGYRIIRVEKKNDIVIVQLLQIPSMSIVWSPKQITFPLPDFPFKGRVSGLCGHLDGSYRTNITEFYTL